MRNLVIILFIFLTGSLHSQSISLEFIDCEFEASSIMEVEGKNAKEIYNSTIEWASYTFVNFDAISQASIENKMFRFKGESLGVIRGPMGFRYGLGYYIQIDIKDNKVRMSMFNMYTVSAESPPQRYSLTLSLGSKGFKTCVLNDKPIYVRMRGDIEQHLNEIFEDYIDYLNNNTSKFSKDW